MTGLDLDFVRAQFPAFSDPSLEAFAFFENAGGSYPCGDVVNRLTRFYTSRKMQPYGPAAPTRIGGDEMDEAGARLAALLNIEEDELSFGPSTTQNVYVLAEALRGTLGPLDAIIVTDQDHEANTGAWRRLEAAGVEIRVWPVDPDTGMLARQDLERLLDARVRLVAFPHCSNIIGAVNPVRDWVDLIHHAGALACVDGVSYAPHGLPDIAALGADIYLFSSYKTYGPHQGLMAIRRHVADALPNQAHYFNAGSRPKRFTPAGPDHAQVAASAGMADYIDALDSHHFNQAAEPAEKMRRVARLMAEAEALRLAPLMAYLQERRDIRLLGPEMGPGKVPTVALLHKQAGLALAEKLADLGIITGGGDFYAVRLLQAMGIDPGHGVLRMSFVHYNSDAEINRLIEGLDRVFGENL